MSGEALPMETAAPSRAVPRWRFGEPTERIAAVVRRGGVVAFPTESSYGLGADPSSATAIAALYTIKGRPDDRALPVVFADYPQLDELGTDPADPGFAVVEQVWPAALTLVVQIRGDVVPPAAAGERASLAIRMPAHAPLRSLLRAVGPLTATSANRSGEEPILGPDDLEPLLAGHDAVIVDGGVLAGGPPSTLVTWRDARFDVLRVGAFDPALLDAILTQKDARNRPS